MQPSVRQQELETLYEKRRGHVPQISITDDNHHVTEAIGSYYDDDDPMAERPTLNGTSARPLSFVRSPDESYQTKEAKRAKRNGSYFDYAAGAPHRLPITPTGSNEKVPGSGGDGDTASPNSLKSPGSLGSENGNGSGSAPGTPPSLSRQSSTDTATSHFPLNDIDYESSPAAVAQELSNLQAIRRMSMNVDTADPDLPQFASGFGAVPTVAPKGEGDENDAARLFWVPARLHPELAPKEFKTFIEERVDKIKRRSGDAESLLSDGLDRSGSGSSSLRRKKSMLSRQIETQDGYQDGAERLERKRSKGMALEGQTPVDLLELETLVNDPAQLIRRLSLDNARRSSDPGVEIPADEDMPVLPPGGQSLKRSTRTTYRRGSFKRGERVPFSRRAQQRITDSESEDTAVQSPVTPTTDEPVFGLTRARTEPISPTSPSRQTYPSGTEDGLRWREAQEALQANEHSINETLEEASPSEPAIVSTPQEEEQPPARPQHRPFQSRLASGTGRTTAQLPGYDNQNPLPQIIETLPDGTKVPKSGLLQSRPDRKPSHEHPRGYNRGGAHMRPAVNRDSQPNQQRSSTLDDISSRPSPLPGSGNTSTDALTMVPTFDDRKTEKKEPQKKSGWKWILGSDEDKSAKEEKNSDAASIKSAKSTKLSKSATERARLDLLQTSIDGNTPIRGRESLVLNRDDLKLEEERSKTSKNSSSSNKKEEKNRDSGLLSAIFGVKKKTLDPNEANNKDSRKRKSDRNASPEPPQRILKPDIDYNWTRFSILEERAIYRMAHIKLANPRRALYSQVLLSNFMYSYLAKVQLMHPQVQIPPAHQKAQQQRAGGGGKQEDLPSEFTQYQRWQQQQERESAERDGSNSTPPNNGSTLEITPAGGSVKQSRTSPEYESEDSSPGYDTRSSGEFEYDHSSYQHQQQQQQQQQQQGLSTAQQSGWANGVGWPGGGGGGAAGGGSGAYSVAQTHDYLGYAKDEQPFTFDGRGLWDDDDGGGGENGNGSETRGREGVW